MTKKKKKKKKKKLDDVSRPLIWKREEEKAFVVLSAADVEASMGVPRLGAPLVRAGEVRSRRWASTRRRRRTTTAIIGTGAYKKLPVPNAPISRLFSVGVRVGRFGASAQTFRVGCVRTRVSANHDEGQDDVFSPIRDCKSDVELVFGVDGQSIRAQTRWDFRVDDFGGGADVGDVSGNQKDSGRERQ